MPAHSTLSSEAICVSTPSARRCMERKSNRRPAASMMISSPRRVSIMRWSWRWLRSAAVSVVKSLSAVSSVFAL